MASGPAFDALVERLEALCRPFAPGLYCHHMETAPVELAVDLERLARQLGRDPNRWLPQDLPAVLDYLPAGKPLALYGRGPNWLYAALAVHALPAPLLPLDVRLGWILPPSLHCGTAAFGPLRAFFSAPSEAPYARMDLILADAYLDITDLEGATLPPPPSAGMIVGSRLPLWLWAALARLYAPLTDWLAVAQPQLTAAGAGWAVVVHSRGAPPLGSAPPI